MVKRQISLRTMLVIIAAIAFALAVFLAILPVDPFSGSDFDREVWLQFADDYRANNPRASMVEDLKLRYLLPGMKESDVVELLGKPERTPAPNYIEYIVGMWSGTRLDHDGLVVKFDGNGKLVMVYCVQH